MRGLRVNIARRRRWLGFLIVPVTAVVVGMLFYFGWLMGTIQAVPADNQYVLPVFRHDIGELVQMDIEEYVRGVVAAEMPATFHYEALKAQAVAARTFALQLVQDGRPLSEHPEAIISTNPSVHQAWISTENLRNNWGLRFLFNWSKITRATKATRGMVLMHDGEFIFPAYHSSSGGHTEDSERYWSGAVPYLRGVEDPYVAGTRYEATEARVPVSMLATAFGGTLAAVAGRPVIEVVTRHPSGRVEWARVGDQIVSGKEIRERLGLRSNWFEVDVHDDQLLFTVRGFGHGVGLSQYGADGMGRAGYTFDQILHHYYTGVSLVTLYD